MKHVFKVIFLCVLAVGPFSFGETPSLASPDQLLKQASQSQQGLLEAIDSLLYNYGEIQDQVQFQTYFDLLPQFDTLSKKFSLDQLYPGAVKVLGSKLTRFGVKWLSVLNDPTDRILAYHQWASVDAGMDFIDRMEHQIQFSESEEGLTRARDTLLALQDWATMTYPKANQLTIGYRELTSKVAIRFLSKPTLSRAEREKWLQALGTENAMWEYSQVLRARLMQKSENAAGILTSGVFELRILMGLMADGQRMVVSRSLVAYIQDLLMEAMTRILELRIPLDLDEATLLTKSMSDRQAQALGSLLAGPRRMPEAAYMQYFLNLVERVKANLEERGLVQDEQKLDEYLIRQGGSFYANLKQIEGTYTLRSSADGNWIFTVMRVNDSEYRMTFGPDSKVFTVSTMSLIYDRERNRFTAFDHDADLLPDPNPVLFFQLNDKHEMELYYPNGKPELRHFRGKRTEVYPDYMATKYHPHSTEIEGEFEGEVQIPGSGGQQLHLVIVPLGMQTNARLSSKTLDLAFQTGTNSEDGFVYLTSPPLKTRPAVQLRVYMKDNILHGVYIDAASGVSAHEFTMRKVKSFGIPQFPQLVKRPYLGDAS